MSRIRIAGLALVALCATLARATDNIETKKLSIKDNTDPTKRQVQVLSKDSDVSYSGAINPAANGASVHFYSATDDLCVLLPGGASLWTDTGTIWKFKDTSTKNSARISNGKLQVKIKNESPGAYTLSDNGTQGTVDAQVQFGSGTRYCMKCSGSHVIKDDGGKFLGKDCDVAVCDAEPSTCAPPTTTSSSTSSTSTSTSTTCTIPASPRTTVKGSLVSTIGHMTYNATLGVPGANAACNMNFPGTHACTLAELQGASATDLSCLKDTSNFTVTSLWAIDPTADPLSAQCHDDVNFICPTPTTCPAGHTWEYGTAHTTSRGEIQPVDSSTGTLGTLLTGQQCNGSLNWVACCQ